MQPLSSHLLRPTMFLGSFLLFLIQPIIAKMILPWFGGSAAVWTSCMMFFQVMLVLGYAYSHILRRWLSCSTAFFCHTAVLGAACCLLPVIPNSALRRATGNGLNFAVAWTLLVTVGLPYFALAANSTLVQLWHEALSTSNQKPADSGGTYRLYAVSNLGSMLALLFYPFLIEPFATLSAQAWIWSAGFIVYAAMCLLTAWPTTRLSHWQSEPKPSESETFRPSAVCLWFMLACVASVILLATTNLMCQEIASVPFLWILPLAAYLLSFIICFEQPRLYHRAIFLPLLCVSIVLGIGVVQSHLYVSILLQITVMTSVCFFVSMVCHGELERLKPPPAKLTTFYLTIAIGGAVGGIFTALLAPFAFDHFIEFQLAIIGCLALATLQVYRTAGRSVLLLALFGCGLTASVTMASLMLQTSSTLEKDTLITRQRNEYGVVMVTEDESYRRFVSGNVDHGGQNRAHEIAFEPSGYYTENSGVGIAFRRMREFKQTQGEASGINACVVGMGIGAMLSWCEPEDHFSFYELNPAVEEIAETHFSYLERYRPQTDVYIGDGRILLQRQLEQTGGNQFDLLFVDAFSSDAIPQHLITSQCVDIYLKQLRADGMLVFHITNRFVDLRPVIATLAVEKGLSSFVRENKNGPKDKGTLWVCLSRNKNLLSAPWMDSLTTRWPDKMPKIQWTDDFAPLAPVTTWNIKVDIEAIQESQSKTLPTDNQRSDHQSGDTPSREPTHE